MSQVYNTWIGSSYTKLELNIKIPSGIDFYFAFGMFLFFRFF